MRPYYLRTYRRPDPTLRVTWRGRALALLACAALLSCLGGCGGGEDMEPPDDQPAADTDSGPIPAPPNVCQLNPKACI